MLFAHRQSFAGGFPRAGLCFLIQVRSGGQSLLCQFRNLTDCIFLSRKSCGQAFLLPVYSRAKRKSGKISKNLLTYWVNRCNIGPSNLSSQSGKERMKCTKTTVCMYPSCVAVECYTPGHICMARCIRPCCAAPKTDISAGNAVMPYARELRKSPRLFYTQIPKITKDYAKKEITEMSNYKFETLQLHVG